MKAPKAILILRRRLDFLRDKFKELNAGVAPSGPKAHHVKAEIVALQLAIGALASRDTPPEIIQGASQEANNFLASVEVV